MYISDDRYEFLLYVLFGSESNPYIASSKVAYRDLCRTLRFGAKGGEAYRKHVDSVLESRVHDILNRENLTQSDYDEWHYSVCIELVKYYALNTVTFTVGHAQKWLNMMLKYLYIRGGANIESVLPYLHVPLDLYIFRAAERELLISRPCSAWSKLDNYEKYIDYQRNVRKKVEGPPLLWEIEAWLDEASHMNKTQDEQVQL